MKLSVFSVWPEDVDAGRLDAPLQHGLWKPEEERGRGEGSTEVQSPTPEIFEVFIKLSLFFYNL